LPTDKSFELPVKIETLAFIVVAATSLILRLNHLSADPPIGLSVSQGVYTDPPQYISFARNLVLWGSFNPLHDFRLIFFLKSAVTLVSYLIFKIGGVGYAQANLVGLVFSFPTIILFYFAVRKAAGNLAALFFLIFISLDYNQMFFGRLSFLENSMNFFAVLSFAVLIYSTRAYAFLIAGIFLGAAVFFGKIIGLIYLLPFVCFAGYAYFYSYRPDRRKFTRHFMMLAIGFAAVLLFWYFFSYRPTMTSVEGYIEDQAVGLYGAPHALKSFDNFVYKYVSFGATSNLFTRMPVPALLAWGMILLFFFRAGFAEAWKKKLFGISPGVIFMMALVLGAYGALMIWNYRPLRYQTMLIYPVCGLAGVFVSYLIGGVKTALSRRGHIFFPLLLFVFSLIPIYQLLGPVYRFLGYPYHFVTAKWTLLTVSLLMTILVGALMRFAPASYLSPRRRIKNILIAAAVILTVVPHAVKYLKWSSAPTYHTICNSRDLATVVSPEAVISGPHAAQFTQENRLMNLIHMFGVATVDSAFFRRYPITHLLLDKANAENAREQYPEIMDKASIVVRYQLPNRSVDLYRVAGATGNIQADNYQLSDFEMALYYYSNEDVAGGNEYMVSHLNKHPDNITANLVSGRVATNNAFFDEAEYYFLKTLEFSPTDFHLRFKLGEFYITMYKETQNIEFKDKAMEQFKLARKFNPDSRRLKREINDLLSGKDSIKVE
jgi:hypothetical protein